MAEDDLFNTVHVRVRCDAQEVATRLRALPRPHGNRRMIAVVIAGIGVMVSIHLVWRTQMSSGLARLRALERPRMADLVLQLLGERGFSPAADTPPGHPGDYRLLVRRRQRHLLLCRQGPGRTPDAATLRSFTEDIGLAQAAGGFLVVHGRAGSHTRASAAPYGIEILGTESMWPELRRILPSEVRQQISKELRRRLVARLTVTWLLMLAAGTCVHLGLRAMQNDGSSTPSSISGLEREVPQPTIGPANPADP